MEELGFTKVINIFLKGKNIYVRNFILKDINKKYISWFSGENHSLVYSRHYKKKYSRNNLINYFHTLNSSNNLYIGIFDLKNNEIVGTISVYFNFQKNEGNLGILIGEERYHSKGIGKEACKLVINYILKKQIVRTIVAGTKKENIKMINLMKNLKMKKIINLNSSIANYKTDKLIK
mgnify:FL=1